MRFAITLAVSVWIGTVVFSSPIPRMLLRRGLFSETLSLTDATAAQIAVEITNALTDDPTPCDPMKEFFQQLAAGEDAGGATTVGDRAVTGARKLLGLQSAGQGGLVQMVTELTTGDLSNQTVTALIEAFTNPARTMASLQTYKFLVDSQSALQNMTTLIGRVGGNNSIVSIANEIQPVLLNVENAIDGFGADFSVQNILNQTADIENILSLVETSGNGFKPIQSSNGGHLSSVNAAILTAQIAMNNLASAAQNASNLANSPPTIPIDSFTRRKGNACQL